MRWDGHSWDFFQEFLEGIGNWYVITQRGIHTEVTFWLFCIAFIRENTPHLDILDVANKFINENRPVFLTIVFFPERLNTNQ